MSHGFRSAALVVGAMLACTSCKILGRSKPYGLTLASDPPGARVLVDRRDSGFVTPCRLALDPGDSYRIDFEYPGYVPATRRVESDRKYEVILWDEMYVSPRVWNFPLWLNLGDFFTPVKSRKVLIPGRVYVRLERTADQ